MHAVTQGRLAMSPASCIVSRCLPDKVILVCCFKLSTLFRSEACKSREEATSTSLHQHL
jgi:hypothetical protein